MTRNKTWFKDLKLLDGGDKVAQANEDEHQIQDIGTIPMRFFDSKIKVIKNVLYVLGLQDSLLYVGTMTDHMLNVEFSNKRCQIKDIKQGFKVIANGFHDNSCGFV